VAQVTYHALASDVTIYVAEYNKLIQLRTTQPPASPVTIVAQSVTIIKSLNPLLLDPGSLTQVPLII